MALVGTAVGGAALVPAAAAAAQGAAAAASGSVPSVELTVDGAARSVDLAGYFTGTVNSYRATSTDTAVASVSTSGSTVTVTPEGAGSTTVTVTATNTAGSATQTFTTKVLPAGCLVTLGTLTAGSITTQTGSWDRDDGCRSTNATSTAHNRYARYYTFTVTEALEAWFRLSSTQGKYLYLLEGEGTGGSRIDAAATRSTTSAASFWEVLQPGTYTLETTTYYTNREGNFELSIDSMPLVSPAGCVTSLGTITAGSITTQTGSWDRDDACRSTHRTISQQARYYAQYYTFTVTEALEGWFRLSSTQGKYLYLLEGEGTGGSRIDAAATRSTTSAASFWEVLQPGTYTLEVTTYSSAREGNFELSIDSMPLTPPPNCVVSLGTLPDEVTTWAGSWDRDDACRSTHRTTSQQARYYAQYYTFTVTEALEGWFRLSSTQGKYLYLLEGEGTGGSRIDAAATRSTTSAASFWEVLQPGTYTLEVTTYSSAREGNFELSIDSMPLVPTARCVVSLGSLPAGEVVSRTGTWARAGGCRSAHATTSQQTRHYARYYSFTLAEAADVLISLSSSQGKRLYLLEGDGTGGRSLGSTSTSGASTRSLRRTLQPGTYTIETTSYYGARKAGFTLVVDPRVLPPVALMAGDALPDLVVLARGPATALDVSVGFSGTVDSYSAASSNSAVATASVDDSTVTLTGVAVGAATVTVTATNPAGSASQRFSVRVDRLPAPIVATRLPSRTATVGGTITVDLAPGFTGHVDSYTVTPNPASAVTAAVNGTELSLTSRAAGAAVVTITATNASGSVVQSFTTTASLPEPLQITASGSAYCIASEGRVLRVGRDGVGQMRISYAIRGGVEPYTITSSAAADASSSTATGELTVSCARDGIDLATIDETVNAVESGPKTVTVTVTDATGITTDASVTVEIAELVWTAATNDAILRAGRTYTLGSPDSRALITLPTGLDLRFGGVSEHNMAHFADTVTGKEITLDWHNVSTAAGARR
ncbi:MAG: Ig-like domain-containing protein [bacterium]|nr:Ig-like domain-containing protein [bacterium]